MSDRRFQRFIKRANRDFGGADAAMAAVEILSITNSRSSDVSGRGRPESDCACLSHSLTSDTTTSRKQAPGRSSS